MKTPSRGFPFTSRSHVSLVFTGFAVIAAFILSTAPRTANGSASPYVVVRTDTQESVTRQVTRLNTGESATVVVTQKEKAFLPTVIEIRVGQAVEILNEDNTLHNAYCVSGDFKYNSGPQQPGTKSSLTFTTAGSYEVRCAIHPKMRLAVTVIP